MKPVSISYDNRAEVTPPERRMPPALAIEAAYGCVLTTTPSPRNDGLSYTSLRLTLTREILWAIDAERERIERELERCEQEQKP